MFTPMMVWLLFLFLSLSGSVWSTNDAYSPEPSSELPRPAEKLLVEEENGEEEEEEKEEMVVGGSVEEKVG